MAKKSRVKKAKNEQGAAKIAAVRSTAGRDFQRSFQRKMSGEAGKYQG